ncbi:MAG: UpxY family transcription antiterminator [Terriglobia bacterium]
MLACDTQPLADYRQESAGWLAIYTRHQHENLAAHSLAYKGFEVFLPQYIAVRRWSDRTKELSAPLFPGYLFLRGRLEQRLSILTTLGVLGLVGFAGVPAFIPDAEIEALRQTLAHRPHIEPYPFLKCGDWVRVKCGPLEGIEGILVRKKKQFRLVLSVQLLQKSAAVEVDAWMVERPPRPERRGSERSFTISLCACT